jgi:argininosuccinate synthase
VTRVVLAYAGGLDDTCAIAWLADRYSAEVSAVTLDIGQEGDPGAIRERALAAGARRAHVIDARERFVRECVIPALRRGAFDAASRALAHPLIVRALVEIAAIEEAPVVAHGAAGPALHAALVAAAAPRDVLAPAAEWASLGIDPRAYARQRGLHVGAGAEIGAHNLIVRRAPVCLGPADAPAHVDLTFDGGIPVAIYGVPLALPVLVDSLSLIAGQHGIGGAAPLHAPAAAVLGAAYAALGHDAGEVRFRLLNGEHTVLAVNRLSQLVNHA